MLLIFPYQATRSTIRFAFWILVAAADVFLTARVTQHPFGTSMKIALDTLLYSSVAAGVEIIEDVPTGSPSRERASEIAATAPPVGIATLALK